MFYIASFIIPCSFIISFTFFFFFLFSHYFHCSIISSLFLHFFIVRLKVSLTLSVRKKVSQPRLRQYETQRQHTVTVSETQLQRKMRQTMIVRYTNGKIKRWGSWPRTDSETNTVRHCTWNSETMRQTMQWEWDILMEIIRKWDRTTDNEREENRQVRHKDRDYEDETQTGSETHRQTMTLKQTDCETTTVRPKDSETQRQQDYSTGDEV